MIDQSILATYFFQLPQKIQVGSGSGSIINWPSRSRSGSMMQDYGSVKIFTKLQHRLNHQMVGNYKLCFIITFVNFTAVLNLQPPEQNQLSIKRLRIQNTEKLKVLDTPSHIRRTVPVSVYGVSVSSAPYLVIRANSIN
jgi:hypothetical protein